MSERTEEWSFNVDAYTARLIGRENVSRLEGAIMELVKNAYDADAKSFCMYYSSELGSLFLIDNGTGMSRDTIRDYWMTIGNSSKKEKYISSKKRIQTGAKGIGRFALDRIAENSDMLTIQHDHGIEWIVYWNEFDGKKQLTDVKALVRDTDKKLYEHANVDAWPNQEMANFVKEEFSNDGTAFILTGLHDIWDDDQINIIRNSLENMFPYEIRQKGFTVYFFEDSTSLEDAEINDKQIDNYDYKISFRVWKDENNKDVLSVKIKRNEFDLGNEKEIIIKEAGFTEQDIKYFADETKDFTYLFSEIGEDKNCIGSFEGTLYFNKVIQTRKDKDRFFQKDISGRKNYVKEYGGIKIFRDYFRVRPYGEYATGEFDWLKLAERSAMSPAGVGSRGAWKVNVNQMMGYVNISRTNTNLEDAANRNGIQDGEGFEQLKRLLKRVIVCFEQDRQEVSRKLLAYYEKTNPLKRTREIIHQQAIEEDKKGEKIGQTQLSAKTIDEYVGSIEKQYQEDIEELRDENRMLQTLATTGIVTNIFMHEIRTLMNNIGLELDSAYDALALDKDYDSGINNIRRAIGNKKNFASWFAVTIDSIRKDKRKRRKIDIKEELSAFIQDWEKILSRQNISLHYQCDSNLFFKCFPFDLQNIINNLITNSLASFERDTGNLLDKTEIILDISAGDHEISIHYEDTGWGLIPRYKAKPEIILEAFESDRGVAAEDEGTGMGMWIINRTVSEYGGRIQLDQNKTRDRGFEIKISLGETYV